MSYEDAVREIEQMANDGIEAHSVKEKNEMLNEIRDLADYTIREENGA